MRSPLHDAGAFGRRDRAVVFVANQVMRLASRRYVATLKALVVLGMDAADRAKAEARRGEATR